MSGIFSKNSKPRRPGAYFNFEAVAKEVIPPSSGSIVCIPVTNDWGPFKTPTLVTSLPQYQSIFGPSVTSAGYKAVKQAFKGEGLPGRGGAGAVLVHRFGGSAAAKAIRTLTNTNAAAAGIVVTARYEGTYGNSISVTTQNNATNAANDDFIILLNGVEVERFTYVDAAPSGLVTQINDPLIGSKWITATLSNDGFALTTVANQALTGGNDGTTLIIGDWTAVMTAVEPKRFSVFAPFDLTDSTIQTSLQTWAATLNRRGKRFVTVVGGALDENVAAANTRGQIFSTVEVIDGVNVYPGELFLNVGVGGVVDTEFGVLSTSQLAPRIAGIVAARGEEKSLTFARLAGVTSRNFATEANILTAFDGGTIVLSEDTHPTAPIRIEKGLTTYIGGDATKPYLIYRTPKFVRTMHGIETEITEWAEREIIGQHPVNDVTRALVVAEALRRITARVDRGVLQSGAQVYVDPDPPPTAGDEHIALAYGITFGRSVEQLWNTVRVV